MRGDWVKSGSSRGKESNVKAKTSQAVWEVKELTDKTQDLVPVQEAESFALCEEFRGANVGWRFVWHLILIRTKEMKTCTSKVHFYWELVLVMTHSFCTHNTPSSISHRMALSHCQVKPSEVFPEHYAHTTGPNTQWLDPCLKIWPPESHSRHPKYYYWAFL